MTTTPEYAKGGFPESGYQLICGSHTPEWVGDLPSVPPEDLQSQTEEVIKAIKSDSAPAPDSGKEILDSYALTLGLHALGIPVEFKEVPEYKCKDATTPINHA